MCTLGPYLKFTEFTESETIEVSIDIDGISKHKLALYNAWGALQIQDRSPQSRNWRPVASCKGKFSRERSATVRPVS